MTRSNTAVDMPPTAVNMPPTAVDMPLQQWKRPYLIVLGQLHTNSKDEVTNEQRDGEIEVNKVVNSREQLLPVSVCMCVSMSV